MAPCSGDSESFIYEEEEEIKSFHPQALVYFIYQQSQVICLQSTLFLLSDVHLHQRERDRKKKTTDKRWGKTLSNISLLSELLSVIL